MEEKKSPEVPNKVPAGFELVPGLSPLHKPTYRAIGDQARTEEHDKAAIAYVERIKKAAADKGDSK